MTDKHKLTVKCIDGTLAVTTLDGTPIAAVCDLNIHQETSEITTATIVVELHSEDGAKLYHGMALTKKDITGEE
ncbi:hypothetical protein [Leclercia sp.]|uniref:hypothetical protein n=1 Tax=Leclercia sp. TaxID=1898428 RepID=UPI0028A8768D|nr:hypothetical protein [Leclercia sp.]